MKKLISVSLIVLMSLSILGCNQAKETESQVEQPQNLDGIVKVESEMIEDAKDRKIVIIDVENTADFYMAANIVVDGYDEAGKLVESYDHIRFSMLDKQEKTTRVVRFLEESVVDYKISVETDLPKDYIIPLFDSIEVSHSEVREDVEDFVSVQVTNDSEFMISLFKVTVVYYLDDVVVNANQAMEADIEPGKTVDIVLHNSFRIEYDRYEVYTEGAYGSEF